MNKIFKVIWNPATGSYTVASETAKSRGKKSGRSKLLISALVAGGLLSSFGAYAEVSLDGGTSAETTPLTNGWIAIGHDSIASSVVQSGAAAAIGYQARALGEGSTALGYQSLATGDRAMALGQMSKSSGNRAAALGSGANAAGDHSLALGGATNAQGEYSVAIGRAATTDSNYALSMGYMAKANGLYSLAMGAGSATSNDNAIAIGNKTQALGVNSTALGNASQASGESSIALGSTSEASEQNAIALGQGSIASKVNSIALGSNSLSSGENAIALGEGSAAGGSNSLAFGSQSRANGNDSVAIGVGAAAATDNSVAIGAGSTTDASNTVSVGNSATKRKIVNMAAGAISNTSTDAINGSQLYTISDSVAKRLGGGATVGSDGTVTAVSYALRSGTYNNVGDALSGIDNNTLQWNKTAGAFSANHGANATNKITNVAKGTVSATSTDVVNGSQLYDLQQDALLWNGTAFSAAHGTEATSKITNVTAGNLTAGSTDAVNGSQLKTTNDNVTTNTTNIATNTTNITNLTDAVNGLGDDSLLWNKTAGAFSAAHGTDATSKITNVKAGDLTAGSTDAVNGSQLKTTNDNVSTNTTNITNLTDSVGDLKDDSLLWNKAAGAFSAAHGTEATSKITNLLAGKISSNSTDAINGSQLYGVADSFTSYLGGGADISDTGVLSGPTYTIGGTDYTNVGDALAAINTSFSTSLGDALLWDATAGKFSAKHGINNAPSVITDVANGAVSSTSSDAINGSQLYGVSDYIADALGGNAVVNTDGSITTPTYAIAGGSYNNVGDALEAIDTTLDDALLWDTTANGGNGAFSAAHGKDKTASVITNVANGAVSATSSDAINGSQLYSTNKYIADALGGDAEVNADGTITAPTYTIANTDYNNVGEALDALDNNALLWDEDAGAYNASHDGNASKITNVAAGDLSTTSTDAVNGSQLNATNILVTQNSQMINQLAGNTSETYIEENGAGINYVRTNDTGLTFTDASAAGIGSTAVGYNTVAKGDSSVAMGYNSFAKGDAAWPSVRAATAALIRVSLWVAAPFPAV